MQPILSDDDLVMVVADDGQAMVVADDGQVFYYDVGWNGSDLVEGIATQFYRLMGRVESTVHPEL